MLPAFLFRQQVMLTYQAYLPATKTAHGQRFLTLPHTIYQLKKNMPFPPEWGLKPPPLSGLAYGAFADGNV